VLASGSACLVVGVGINADFEESLLPPDVRTPATTLRATLGRAIDVGGLAERLVERLGGVLARSGESLDDSELRRVLGRLAYLDEPVRVSRLDGTVVEGVLAGLSPDGRAAVRVGDGIEWVVSGDVAGARRERG
jgi:biotin-(acetyl-CoA carboxylase) ligase